MAFARHGPRTPGWRRVGLLVLTMIAAIIIFKLQQLMFGPGPTHRGGRIGRWIDNAIRKAAFDEASIRHDNEFQQCMGHALPPIVEKGANQVGVDVILNSWLAQVLMRMKRRRDMIQQYMKPNRNTKNGSYLPRIIIQPNVGDWFRPIEFSNVYNYVDASATGHNTGNFTILVFDDEQVNNFMMEHYEQLYTSIYPKLNIVDRVQLFGIAATSIFGGIFVAADIRNHVSFNRMAPGALVWIDEHTSMECNVTTPSLWFQVDHTYQQITVLAATPNHPKLKCSLELFTRTEGDEGLLSLITMIYERQWDLECTNRCCPQKNVVPANSDSHTSLITVDVTILSDMAGDIVTRPRFSVIITERAGNKPLIVKKKNRCNDRLRQRGCSAGWLCNRCLKTSYAGTFEICAKYCRSCYQEIVCTVPSKTTAIIDVKVTEYNHTKQKRIPRIIHQTYYETLTTLRYPHLQRLQNSWKASGWDYKFYTDNDCYGYIQRNYPKRFVEAYDSILPGAFKADFFRLLVLFKEGGIYSDIDVQLEADLDNFIPKDLSFFVPRDVPLDYWPNSNYCLWNGLMGSAPGHPIIAKAIEDILSTIQNRYDYYDVEGRLCSKHPDVGIWKLRTLPILILTGPCALGMSMNAALGNNDIVAGFQLGWIYTSNLAIGEHQPVDYFWGDSMTLLTDRYDIGELRFTDIDRNLMIASTNHDRLAKSPIDDVNIKATKVSAHYSKSDTDIVGEYRVYKDDMVANENVKLLIRHEYA